MAYARSFDRYHKNWQMVFEYKPKTDLEKWEKELQKLSIRIITWTPWEPYSLCSNTTHMTQSFMDFNRKMFFIMNEKHV